MTAADDYVTKPISPRQFLARVDALLRRSQMSPTSDYQHDDITVGEITLGLTDMRARVNGAEVLLTPREMSLLHPYAQLAAAAQPDPVHGALG